MQKEGPPQFTFSSSDVYSTTNSSNNNKDSEYYNENPEKREEIHLLFHLIASGHLLYPGTVPYRKNTYWQYQNPDFLEDPDHF